MIPGRENDWFGVGYFYNHIVVGRFTGFAGLNDEAQGFEAFYNVGITPAAHLTLDIQVVDGALPDADDAVVLGARLGMSF